VPYPAVFPGADPVFHLGMDPVRGVDVGQLGPPAPQGGGHVGDVQGVPPAVGCLEQGQLRAGVRPLAAGEDPHGRRPERELRRRLLASREVRSFSCATIPAPLQAAEYAQAAAGHEPAEDWTRLAEDESRSLTFVVTEGALRTWPGQVSMTDQLARVAR
jgi:Domain of unknown function (DUF5753)